MSLNLIRGDCLDVMPTLDAASVDLVICDLPYGSTACKWDIPIPLDQLWFHYRRLLKPGAPVVLTATQPFASALVTSNERAFRHDWIWEKGNASGHLNARRMPMRAHEAVLVFCDIAPPYFPQKTSGHARKTSSVEHRRGCKKSDNYGATRDSGYDSTERFPRSVIKFSMDKQRSSLHPTQKPVALMEYLIKTYSRPGAVVLDNAMGSGTTGVAALNLGRSFIGIERDDGYFSIAYKRITRSISPQI